MPAAAAWLNGTCASSLVAAQREIGLAKGLHRRLPGIVSAMVAGLVSEEQARAMVTVLKKLPATLATDQVQLAEKTMIGLPQITAPRGC